MNESKEKVSSVRKSETKYAVHTYNRVTLAPGCGDTYMYGTLIDCRVNESKEKVSSVCSEPVSVRKSESKYAVHTCVSAVHIHVYQ